MKLLKKKQRTFDIQVQDMALHIRPGRTSTRNRAAAALSFWEKLQSYALRNPEFRRSKRPLDGCRTTRPRSFARWWPHRGQQAWGRCSRSAAR